MALESHERSDCGISKPRSTGSQPLIGTGPRTSTLPCDDRAAQARTLRELRPFARPRTLSLMADRRPSVHERARHSDVTTTHPEMGRVDPERQRRMVLVGKSEGVDERGVAKSEVRHATIELSDGRARVCLLTPDGRRRESIEVEHARFLAATLPGAATELEGVVGFSARRMQVRRAGDDVYLWIRSTASEDLSAGWSLSVPYRDLSRELGGSASADPIPDVPPRGVPE